MTVLNWKITIIIVLVEVNVNAIDVPIDRPPIVKYELRGCVTVVKKINSERCKFMHFSGLKCETLEYRICKM